MEKVNAEEFEQQLKDDSYYLDAMEAKLSAKLREDYDYFLDYYAEDVEKFLCSMKRLRNLHNEYAHEFDASWFGDLT